MKELTAAMPSIPDLGPDAKVRLVMLYATSSYECYADQQAAFDLLEEWKIPYETIDGSDASQRTVRNHLWTLVAEDTTRSYPQFFLRQKPQPGQKTFHYLGDAERLQLIGSHWRLYQMLRGGDTQSRETFVDKVATAAKADNELVEKPANTKPVVQETSTHTEPLPPKEKVGGTTIKPIPQSSIERAKHVQARFVKQASKRRFATPPRVVSPTPSSRSASRSPERSLSRSPVRGIVRDSSHRLITVAPENHLIGHTSSVSEHIDKAKACTARLDALMAKAALLRKTTALEEVSSASSPDNSESSARQPRRANVSYVYHNDTLVNVVPQKKPVQDTQDPTLEVEKEAPEHPKDSKSFDPPVAQKLESPKESIEKALLQIANDDDDDMSDREEVYLQPDSTHQAFTENESVQSLLLLRDDSTESETNVAETLDYDASSTPTPSPSLHETEEVVASGEEEASVVEEEEEVSEDVTESNQGLDAVIDSIVSDTMNQVDDVEGTEASEEQEILDPTQSTASETDETSEYSKYSDSPNNQVKEEESNDVSKASVHAKESEDVEESGQKEDFDKVNYPIEEVSALEEPEGSASAEITFNSTRSENSEYAEATVEDDISQEEEETSGSEADDEESAELLDEESADTFESKTDDVVVGDLHNSYKLSTKDTTETTEMESFTNLADSMASFSTEFVSPQSAETALSLAEALPALCSRARGEDDESDDGSETSNILVLIATQTVDRETPYDQQNALYTIASHGMEYFTIDAADPTHKELRNELLQMSGRGPKYPQFFHVRGDQVTYLGDMDDLERAVDREIMDEWLTPGIHA